MGERKPGRIVTILGDTRKTKNSVTLARRADVLVHESTFNKHEAKMAKAYFHSTSQQAAEVAKEAQVKQLILTHISARYLTKEVLSASRRSPRNFPQYKNRKRYGYH